MRRTKRAHDRDAPGAPVAFSTPLERLRRVNPEASDPLDRVVLHNTVATSNFGCPIDLEALACSSYGCYSPKTFAAVNLRLRSPRATALVFSSGRLVVTGTTSEYAALTAMSLFLTMVQTVAPEARMVTRTIQNLVSVGNLGCSVRLDLLSRRMLLSSMWDPEVFPGANRCCASYQHALVTERQTRARRFYLG